jgi:hypothetical protein
MPAGAELVEWRSPATGEVGGYQVKTQHGWFGTYSHTQPYRADVPLALAAVFESAAEAETQWNRIGLPTLAPAEVDGHIARIELELGELELDVARDLRSLEDGRPGNLFVNRQATLDHVASLRVRQDALGHEIGPLVALYARRQWSRFFLVTNGNGHVHSSTACTTCFPTTSYQWLTGLSGATEAEMVVEWGERACTVCFPSAPTNPDYRRPARIDREAKAARQQEQEARQAARAAKDLAEPLVLPDAFGGRTETVRTVAAAKQALREAVRDAITDPVWLGGLPNWTPGQIADRLAILARRAELAGAALRAKGLGQSELDAIVASARKRAAREVSG